MVDVQQPFDEEEKRGSPNSLQSDVPDGEADGLADGGSIAESIGDGMADAPAEVRFGAWNVQGLASYKQDCLVSTLVEEEIDVLAVCETHLVNSEQSVRWQRRVEATDRYIWFGWQARVPRGEGSGRGSGGVGLLVRKDWHEYTVEL
ncbi:MAG: hypothetical protein P4L83_16225, partial [Nevskia sp.]|nr:hypothetical protein [Nevskia sp.]